MGQHEELQRIIQHNLQVALENQVANEAVRVELSAMVGRGTSPHGVRAQVDHRGLVTDLALSPRSLELDLVDLREDVLASVGAALADMRTQAAPLLTTSTSSSLDDTDILDALDRLVTGAPRVAPSA